MFNPDWELILMFSVRYLKKIDLRLKNRDRLIGRIINFTSKVLNIDIKNTMNSINYSEILLMNFLWLL